MSRTITNGTKIASPQDTQPMDQSADGPTNTRDGTRSSSDLAVSRTSTEEFHHVPFDQFSHQIRELCHLLWPPADNPSRVERLLGGRSNRIVGKFRAKSRAPSMRPGPSSKPASPSKDLLIERLIGGGFNRVIGLTRFPESDSPTSLILRVPRFESAQHDREVAAIHFVRQYTKIPVPEVKFVDYTVNNPLNERYVIQTRIPGHDLQSEHSPCWFPKLTHKQKCVIARSVAETLLELYRVTHPYPGHIDALDINQNDNKFKVRHFELHWNSGLEHEPDLNTNLPFFQAFSFKSDWKPEAEAEIPFEQTTYYFLLAQFGRWKALDLRRNPASIGWLDYYDRLVTMVKQMAELGFLGEDENCLCHRDLNGAPRNIMAQIDDTGSLQITGILDWDSLIFAPKFVLCVPPMWLWAWNDEEEEDEKKANNRPATAEQQELKSIFEQTIGSWFCRYAYTPEYRLARELFKYAVGGMRADTDMENVDELLGEWNEVYASHVAIKDADKSSNSSKSQSFKMAEEL